MSVKINLYNDDCLKIMDQLIEQGVQVDLILTDPPYGTTKCKWDAVIPMDEMWERLNKLIKPNGAIVLFGTEPFSSMLRVSNIKNFKYDWIWNKNRFVNFAAAKKQALKIHEIISVFYKKQCTYNPQGVIEINKMVKQGTKASSIIGGVSRPKEHLQTMTNYPRSILEFKSEMGLHPTQKPVPLLEYLIETYTNKGELVLDFTMGSGSTGVACIRSGRDFIGIERNSEYYKIANDRISKTRQEFSLFL